MTQENAGVSVREADLERELQRVQEERDDLYRQFMLCGTVGGLATNNG